jgi:predicted GNAT family acetyltransferase
MPTRVYHDKGQQRFVGKLEEGEYYLEYNYADGVLVAYHTFVPTSHRGQGLGKNLCTACFEFAREHNILVEPTCSYIRDHFLKQNESYQKYVSKS